MLIDWFTVAVQIVNFLVLLVLLKWLLFDPIVRAMDERQRKIADRLEEARQKHDEATRRAEQLEQRRRELDQRKQQMLDEAREEADQRRAELVEQARREVDHQRDRWQQELRRQQQQFLDSLTAHAGQAFDRAVRQALGDLANTDLQRQTVGAFIQRLRDLDGQQREQLVNAIEQNDNRAAVITANSLPQETRDELTAALKTQFHDGVQPRFEDDPELIAGLELRAGGQALGWNVRQYLDRLRHEVEDRLHEQTEADGATESEQPAKSGNADTPGETARSTEAKVAQTEETS